MQNGIGSGLNSVNYGILPNEGWWQYPRIDGYGGIDPQSTSANPYKKPDSNILVPYGYPVANIEAGVVSGLNTPNSNLIPSYGAVVTIKLDVPINPLATHLAFLHLADITVRLGQRVLIGDIIGHAGDAGSAAGSAPAPLGVALCNGDYYGFGNEWSYNAKADPRLNPVPLIESVATGTPFAATGSITTSSTTSQAVTKFNNLLSNTVSLSPTADVADVLFTLDVYTTPTNPFSVIGNDSNPLNWIPKVFVEIGLNFFVLFIDTCFLLFGVYVCMQVINDATHIQEKVQKAGLDAAKLAVSLA